MNWQKSPSDKKESGWPSGLRRCVQVAVHFCGRGFESHFWQSFVLWIVNQIVQKEQNVVVLTDRAFVNCVSSRNQQNVISQSISSIYHFCMFDENKRMIKKDIEFIKMLVTRSPCPENGCFLSYTNITLHSSKNQTESLPFWALIVSSREEVRMAEWSKALRSGRSPLLWAWVRIPLLTIFFPKNICHFFQKCIIWKG